MDIQSFTHFILTGHYIQVMVDLHMLILLYFFKILKRFVLVYYIYIYIINVLCSQFQYTVTWVPNVCTAVHGNVYVHSVDMFVKTRAMSCYKFGSP